MLRTPRTDYDSKPARFAGMPGVYVMRITLNNGIFTKIGETDGGQNNRLAKWGENQQVIQFYESEGNESKDELMRRGFESQIRKILVHNHYQPVKRDGIQTKDWFAEEALGCAISAIESLTAD